MTLLPMPWVTATTMTEGVQLMTFSNQFPAMLRNPEKRLAGALNMAFTVFVMACVGTLLLMALARWIFAARQGSRIRSQ